MLSPYVESLNPDDTGVILLSSRAWIVSAYVIETKQRLVQKGVLLSLYGHKTVSYKSMCIFGHSVIYETFQEERKMVKHVLKINVWESMYLEKLESRYVKSNRVEILWTLSIELKNDHVYCQRM